VPDDAPEGLPWQALEQTDTVPWEAMRRFADALASDPALWLRLRRLYEESLGRSYEQEVYEYMYVLGIVALAAPRLAEDTRGEIGAFLVAELAPAAEKQDDILCELLEAAAGMLGAPVLPAVLDGVKAGMAKRDDSWFFMLGLSRLAAETDDAALRGRAAGLAHEILRRVDAARLDIADATWAAWLAAELGCTEARGLMRRIADRPPENIFEAPFVGDILEAIDLLDGRPGARGWPKPWQEPVSDWLEPRWRMIRNWWAEGGPDQDDDDDDWDDDEDLPEDIDVALERAAEIADRFANSPAVAGLPPELREDAPATAHWILDYALNYPGRTPEELDEPALREVLLEVFPRKISAEPEFFEHVAPAAEVFLRWLGSEGILEAEAAERLAETVGPWRDEIVANSQDSRRWGLAKGMFMQASAEGYDPTDPGDLDRFMRAYNARLAEAHLFQDEGEDVEEGGLDDYLMPGETIVRDSPKVGRNDPCPCGSGKKYKKCCGRPG
jgi:hypothetical protein